MSEEMKNLVVTDLKVNYGKAVALRGVSLTVESGEFVALVGPNGAGKTTLLNTVSGLLSPVGGEIRWGNAAIRDMKPHVIVAMGISQCPEGRLLAGEMTVEENVVLGAFVRKDRAGTNNDLREMYDLFPRLKERAGQLAGSLSGGERQMVAMARALMSRPKLLMLDEPSLGLSPLVKRSIFEAVKRINERGTAVLLVEQDTRLAFECAARAYVVENGAIVLHDTPQKLQELDEFRQAYLGL